MHVGSTSVACLAAKPIVDISVGVDDPDDDASFVPALIGAGYSLRVIEPEHRMFRTPEHDVHVHVWREGSSKRREQLVFRGLAASERGRAERVRVSREGSRRTRMGVD